MTNTPHAEREARKVGRTATRTATRAERRRKAADRLGKPEPEVNAVNVAGQVAVENPPTMAAGAAGLIGALVVYLVAETDFPIYLDVAITTFGAALGAVFGKLAQRFTYDRVTMDVSVANFVDDLNALGGTPEPEHADVDPDAG